MDYEKAFKEAYKRASLRFGTNVANELFLEYKESKEERIRRGLIEYFYDWSKTKSYCWGIRVTDVIAWLEKQDKTKEYTFKSLPRLLDMIEPTDRAKSYCQKLIDTLLTEGYDTDAKIVKECLKQMNGETVAMAVMDGQTITDKYEPKFKIGDWVVWDNKMSCYIDNIYQGKESLMYTIIDTNNIIRSCSVKIFDNNSHLWSIKDAKDGDVLAVDSMPFIYNGSKNEVTVGAYCGFNAKHRFSFAYNYVINQNITPATKEQCDMLFQKMKETEYEWNAEKKELKKFDFSKPIKYNSNPPSIDKKSDWSEDDEEKFRDVIRLIEQGAPVQSMRDHYTNWFKSLKDRYAYTPSENQMKALDNALSLVKNCGEDYLFDIRTLYEQLKKLKGE